MTFAERQHRAHLERQQRLGKIPPVKPPRPALVQAPTSVPLAELGASPAQIRTIEGLQQEVARLTARLQAMMREDQSPLMTSGRIKPVISAVAKYYRVSLRDIASFRRANEVVRPRQVAMYLAKMLTKHSLPAIGRVFERDHTTVLHAIRRMETLRRLDPDLDAEIRELTERLTPPVAFVSQKMTP